jgi:hypothetical protein
MAEQLFYCNICDTTESVSSATSMIYHRHEGILTMLSAVPTQQQHTVKTKTSKKKVQQSKE